MAVRGDVVAGLRLLKAKVIVRFAAEEFIYGFSSFVEIFNEFVPSLFDALLLELNYPTELLDHVVVSAILGSDSLLIRHLNPTEETIFRGKEILFPHMLQIPSERLASETLSERRPFCGVQRWPQLVCVMIKFEVKFFPLVHPNVGDSSEISV